MGKYNKIPLEITRAAKSGFDQLRNVAKLHSEIMIIDKDKDLQFHLTGLGDNSDYYFRVNKPFKENGKVLFIANYLPYNKTEIKANSYKGEIKTILNVLNSWKEIIHQLDTISVHPEDEIEQQYKEEFEEWFQIVEEDADTKAFSAKQQLLIQNVIEKSIPLLLQEGIKEDDPIIEKATWLKLNLGRLTKKQVICQVKELFVPLRKMGMKTIKKIYDVATVETISMGYRLVISNIGDSIFKLLEG
ncbi:hypothetical protein [Muriicola sp. Z0-33]|uniref:hypothetical protein n=1 Tax=Muriicola sp. Z0-33 TaxID=2816957 RepID=UPI0022382011|nr:hypothetical protein [Muriicola sp. Z0-33]MCW5514717.1 hypothetical protein [Muriicola sp. Z0-33]